MDKLPQIDSDRDWHWHKTRLDADAKYIHAHTGAPERYPCLVRSDWWDDPNGPYSYTHYFTYQKEVTCSACGHKSVEWDFEHTA